MAWGNLPSLGFGGSFTAYSPPTDWGAVIGKTADVLKAGLDIRNAIRTPSGANNSALEQSLTAQNTTGDTSGGGISTPMLLIGGGIAILAVIMVTKS